MRPLWLRMVFSLPEYSVKIDSHEFTGHDIISMKLTRTSEKLPVKGIVESELIIKLRTELAFNPNALIEISVGGSVLMTFAHHFISKISRKGDILTIYAYDRMRMTENDFDDSLYNRGDEPFNSSLLLADLAHQCGFSNTGGFLIYPSELYYDDIHSKTCREILNLVSETSCGVWYCSNDNELKFTEFMAWSHMSAALNTSRLYLHSVKGPFKAVYAKNTADGAVYSAGEASDFRNILKLGGRIIDQSRTSAIMSGIAQKSFQSFSCSYIEVDNAPDGISCFSFPEYTSGLISCRTVVHFGGGGIYVEALAADICEDESDYTDLTGYELRKRIEEGKLYGSTVLTSRGIGFVKHESDDIRESQAAFFTAVGDGLTEFGGAIMDNVMPDAIESVSETVKRITYGSNVYTLSFDKDENGKKSNISLVKEES